MNILIIQTAYLGDVILATSLPGKLIAFYPDAKIDFLVRKGNEDVLAGNPNLREVLVFDKKNGKFKNLFSLLWKIRKKKYNLVINVHRFGSSGFLAGFSGAKKILGFSKNPFSFFYSEKFPHNIGSGTHEIRRNHSLIRQLTDDEPARPGLYPSEKNFSEVQAFKTTPYICIAPGSIWFTKQFPAEKWIEFIDTVPEKYSIYLLGSSAELKMCDEIIEKSKKNTIRNLAGKFSILSTAALMRDAAMNYTNDSAPLHICSAMNAPVRAVFCSTVPSFGFGPLSDNSGIIQTSEKLTCRPCGLHGFNACPEGHFKCALEIKVATMTFWK